MEQQGQLVKIFNIKHKDKRVIVTIRMGGWKGQMKGNSKGKGKNMMMMPPQMYMPYGHYMQPMPYYQPMGDGKGRKGDKGYNGTKGSAKGGQDAAVPEPPQQIYCKCCGKYGHPKSQCRHLQKACNNCHKQGHLQHLCTATKQEQSDNAGNGDDGSKKKAADKVPWLCEVCCEFNEDIHLFKCRRTKDCTGTSPKKTYKANAAKDPSPISNHTAKLLEEADPDKIKQDTEARQKKIETLNIDIEKYETDEWKSTTPIDMTWHRNQRDKLVKEQQAIDEKLGDNGPVLKSMMGDKNRLTNNHLQKMRKLKDETETRKARQETATRKEKEQQEHQEREHLKEMAKIEEHFHNLQENTKEELLKLQEKIAEEEKEYEAKAKEVGSAIALEIAPEAGQAIADKAISAVQASDIYVNEDQVMAVLVAEQDGVEESQKMTSDQQTTVAKSVATLLQTMRTQMAEDIKRQLRHEAEEEKKAAGGAGKAEDKGDGFQVAGKDGRPVRANAAARGTLKPRNPDVIIDDSPERAGAAKRVADSQLQPDDQTDMGDGNGT